MVNTKDIQAYTETLIELKAYQSKLGLADDPPSEIIRVIPGTENAGKPTGSFLPAYPNEQCGTDEEDIKKTLFNLRSLLGFTPPTNKR